MNAPAIALSPDGGLAVHADDDQRVVLATESQGLAQSPWPAPAADSRNGNAR